MLNDSRELLTINSNSFGSNENALSIPPSSGDKVKCFSIKLAPRLTAVDETIVPKV